MASPFPTNAEITFSVASGTMTADSRGNPIPAVMTVTIAAYLSPKGTPGVGNPRSRYNPGVDESEETLSGRVTDNPDGESFLPEGIDHLSKGWATITDPVTGKTKSGYFTLYRGTPSPFGVEAALGASISGIFKGVAQGSSGATPPQPTPGQYAAAVDTAAHKLVALIGGELVLADQTNVSHAAAIAGITLNSVTATGKPLVAREGLVEDSGWNWTPGQPIFLGTNGNLTQDGSTITTGFLMQVGWVPEPTKVWLEIEEAILL